MQISDQRVHRPPHPASARTWPDFTAALRELFAWCGQPKYATVSKASGLAPSNISNLIGKNPLQRPSEAASLRFVEACLTIGGYSPRAIQDSVEEWQQAWSALEAGELLPLVPAGGDAEASARPVRRKAELLLAAGVGALSVVAGGALWILWSSQATADQKAPPASQPTSSAATAGCKPSTIAPTNDVRNSRSWTDVLVCPNVVGARIRLGPSLSDPVVGTLDYDSSWFVCWTTGAEHSGQNRVWYYTKGDSTVSHPEVDKWGYVPASDLTSDRDPDVHAIGECPR